MRTRLLVLALCVLLVGVAATATTLAAEPVKKTADFLSTRVEVMRAVVQTVQEDYVLVYVNKEDFAVTFNIPAYWTPLTVTASVSETDKDGKVRVTLSIQSRDGGTTLRGGAFGSGGAAKKFFTAVTKRLSAQKRELTE